MCHRTAYKLQLQVCVTHSPACKAISIVELLQALALNISNFQKATAGLAVSNQNSWDFVQDVDVKAARQCTDWHLQKLCARHDFIASRVLMSCVDTSIALGTAIRETGMCKLT